MTGKQHKWHKEIKAWADGAEIESRAIDNKVGVSIEWFSALTPEWNNNDVLHRIKTQPKEPQYLYVYEGECSKSPIFTFHKSSQHYVNYIGKIKLENEHDNQD